ncbi:hypothetical protein K437DRAFT_35743 [Tilletiaria anomala UBC 951]|uniref:Uncharacterized protein n=1 Tax=Tilletiaria anomala (strain ATCC 24038 / CBS 436.72 / UBC 951) TaxID=1037660 RepID=A0A066V8E3_TILAU|nr:uncharacterized protein K437DRAFT_35743 [Tilletiaria anomala UBC 951]KDN37746.1 hypothetical protein K437DRAFT_35743 [Tilletiaria anomala UBC 951]
MTSERVGLGLCLQPYSVAHIRFCEPRCLPQSSLVGPTTLVACFNTEYLKLFNRDPLQGTQRRGNGSRRCTPSVRPSHGCTFRMHCLRSFCMRYTRSTPSMHRSHVATQH